MKFRCPNCQHVSDADESQKKLLTSAIENRQRLVMLECPECYKDVPVNPSDLMSATPQKDEQKETEFSVKCPICIDGIVSFVDTGDEKFFGCGACGNVWFTEE